MENKFMGHLGKRGQKKKKNTDGGYVWVVAQWILFSLLHIFVIFK